MSSIDQIREREARSEVQACVRALLQNPLLQAVGQYSDTFRLVRRHADALRAWFASEPAWPLVIEREYARLSKIPARLDDPSFPIRDHKDVPFSRRRYVLLCMVLAALEKAERQTILGHIAEQVVLKARGDDVLERAGMDVRFERRAERMDLIAVIRILIARGVLTRIHGDEDGYIQHGGEVLYTINRSELARVAAMQCGPSTLADDVPHAERPVRLHPSELFAEGDTARRRRSRTTLTRLLLDHPVVYYADLSEEEQAYLTSQRARLTHEIENATGLIAEVRSEGIAMVDPMRKLTDHAMPDEGTMGHAALLLAEFLIPYIETGDGAEQTGRGAGVSVLRIEQHLAEQAAVHKSRWRRDSQEPAGLRALQADVLGRLQALCLLRRDNDTVFPLPALARYRLDPATSHGYN